MKRALLAVVTLVVVATGYLLLWPVPVEPVAWTAPPNTGDAGPFVANRRLHGLERLRLAGYRGPEDLAVDDDGRIYASTDGGWIVRSGVDNSEFEEWVDTGGRPLGIEFDRDGNLIVADAFRGLLSIAPTGQLSVLVGEADGVPVRYADDVDVAVDGRIFFTDASTKFGALEWGGTYEASRLDLIEHGGHGRLLMFDPASGTIQTLLDGINFANGVAVSPDQAFVLVNETGHYRVLKYWLAGPRGGETEPILEALPGFPDNISAGRDGRFWLGLVSPRVPILDILADRPWLRKVILRVPRALQPDAIPYGHVLAIDADGNVLLDLQDPAGQYPLTTGALETEDYLYVSSLSAPSLARISIAHVHAMVDRSIELPTR